MPRYLFIVSRQDPALYEMLKRRFADDANVEVIQDRRGHAAAPPRYPRTERRMHPEINEQVRLRAYAVVTLP
jgi:hypothetical protein